MELNHDIVRTSSGAGIGAVYAVYFSSFMVDSDISARNEVLQALQCQFAFPFEWHDPVPLAIDPKRN